MLLADVGIVSGHSSLADLLFLVAFILGVIAGVMFLMDKELKWAVGWFAVSLIALGFFVS